jgi:hypothetical protein
VSGDGDRHQDRAYCPFSYHELLVRNVLAITRRPLLRRSPGCRQ